MDPKIELLDQREFSACPDLAVQLDGVQIDTGRLWLTAAVVTVPGGALLASQPEVPPDLVSGETVEEVDQQLEAALRMIAQLRGHLESQAQAARVPTGAPARRAPDLSALSPAEKIVHGLSQQQR